MSARNKTNQQRWWRTWAAAGAIKGVNLEMKDIVVGSLIRGPYGPTIRVYEVTHSPHYDIDGVPVGVKGHSVDSNVQCSISFGRVDPGRRIEDWKKWRVVG